MMNENNLKVKVSAKEQKLAHNSNFTFNQHRFISDIYECEKQKYILEKRQNKLLNTIKQKEFCPDYFDTNFYNKYDNESKNHIKRPIKPKLQSFSWPDELLHATIVGIPSGIVFTILHLIIHKIVRGDLSSFELGFGTLIAIVVTVAVCIRNKNNNEKYYIKALRSYEKECKEAKEKDKKIDEYNLERSKYWQNEYEKYRNKIIDNAKIYKNTVMPEVNEIKRSLNAVNNTLQSLYNLRINGVLCLHPNYQGLVPISIIFGYFDTGRCNKLEGHEGAYNLYEDEKIRGMIINKLDTVLKKINQLNHSMIYVGQAIEECNSQLSVLESASNRMISSVNNISSNVSSGINGISNQMSAIETNTANSAYYAEVGARMTAFNTVYNLLKD